MFNSELGEVRDIGGLDGFVTHSDGFGCAMFGPYTWLPQGRYKVIFSLAMAGPPVDASRSSVLIDVVTSGGTVTLGNDSIAPGDLSNTFRTFEIEVAILEYRQLEFRVHVPANGSIMILAARYEKIADYSNVDVDVYGISQDPFMLGHQVRRVLRLLQPARAIGYDKVRLGNIGDGGYICLDDFADIDTAFSFGINDDVSWDRDAADRGLTIYQFDHTVDDPMPSDDRFVFEKKMIAPDRGPDRETISDLVKHHDRGNKKPNIFLKMDIENAEWNAILATDRAELSRFSQIVCELHYFQGLSDPAHRGAVFEALNKIHQDYAVVHIHANNYAGWCDLANIITPCVLEVTFANRALYHFEDTDELFPTALDASCDPGKADMFLGSFRF
ncbi:hypothetical protein Q4F19_04555 [Sphingomonas sp. BIUV-7]|uniref:Methyltransferase FkbM domain-containing protein n=1 Tax=Sphingomonas natans TaxID=3063330 RepID=A0ABT8Y5R5_9SPHN|nr:FkbM family methyltransferase [Sphingomonas sp. BIUV-7]MDO6413646.1 hypothetical protein [Sphingomonas sp. BIUV-7]